jgi:hypothetical protein
MPTASESAAAEAAEWMSIAGRVPELDDVAPTEHAVVGFYDPAPDLTRRGAEWGFVFDDFSLASVCRFAAGLAQAEAEAWKTDDPTVATRAYEQRRFLLGDRVLHWAVPWLDQMGRCYDEVRGRAHNLRDRLLELGDRHRPAPVLTGTEGLTTPGEDSFGPLQSPGSLSDHLASLWSGLLLTDATVRSLSGSSSGRGDTDLAALPHLDDYYQLAARRWTILADAHPGSGRLWLDLRNRSLRTVELLRTGQ